MEKYRLLEKLNFITAELHKSFNPFFGGATLGEYRQTAISKLEGRILMADNALEGKEYLLGDFTIADIYLYNVLIWCPVIDLSLDQYKNIKAFQKRMNERPSVIQAIRAESAYEKRLAS